MALGEIGGVGGELVGDDTFLDVVLVRQPQVFLGRHVAEHGRAVPADHRRADAAGDVVVARRDVGGQRPQGVERGFLAVFELQVHVLLDQVHRHVARPFDDGLHVVLPGDLGEFAQRLQFAQLRFVIGVVDRARTQAVAEAEGDVVGLHDVADFLEVGVEEAFLVVCQAPLGHDRTAAADDAGHAVGGHRDVAQQHAGVDGEVIDALLGLFDQRVAEDFPGQVLGLAVDLLQRLVDRHRADRHGRIADDPFARFVDVLAGGQVHHRVAAPADRPGHFLDFFLNGRAERRVADVGVDLGEEIAADDHRLAFRVIDVVRDDGAAAGDFGTHEFRRDFGRDAGAEVLARVLAGEQGGHFFAGFAGRPQGFDIGGAIEVLTDRHVFHFRRDDAFTGVMHLADVGAGLGAARLAVQAGEAQFVQRLVVGALATEFGTQVGQFLGVAALGDPLRTHGWQAGADVDLRCRVGVGTGTVIDIDRRILLTTKTGRRVGLRDFAHRHLDIRSRAFDIDLAGIGQRLDGSLVDVGVGGEEGVFGVHVGSVRKFSGFRRQRRQQVPGGGRFPTPA